MTIDGGSAADDPTIKSLTAKLTDNPEDQSALYRRGQVYASKGAYSLPSRISTPRSG